METNKTILKTLRDELYLKGFTNKTIESYLQHNTKFLDWIQKEPKKIKELDIKDYVIHLRKKNYAYATINLIISSIKYLFIVIMKRKFHNISSLKKQSKHTGIIDKEVIKDVINKTHNIKHRLLLKLLYSSGIRISEAVKIRIEDIIPNRLRAVVRQGKGQRDREIIISNEFLNDYYKYLKKYQPIYYLFEGNNNHLTVKSGQSIVKNLFNKFAKIKAHSHMLRASFAIHLLERGIDSKIIQVFTGHKDSRSLNSYICYADFRKYNIKSPID